MKQSAKIETPVQSLIWSGVLEKPVTVEFTAERQTSHAGLLVPAALDRRWGLTAGIAAGLRDRRDPDLIQHTLLDMLRQRLYGALGGFADANDAARLKDEPVFRFLLGRSLKNEEDALASQPTLSRFENALSVGSIMRWASMLTDAVLLRQREHRGKVRRITLDLDPTEDPTHGQQEFSFFNSHYDTWCFLPLLAFATFHDERNREEPERYLLAALLRRGNANATLGFAGLLRRLVRRCREVFPEARLRVRLDGAYATPEVFVLLEELQVEYVVNMGKNDVLKRAAEPLLERARLAAVLSGKSERVFGEIKYAAQTWNGVSRRAVIKAEATIDPRAPDKGMKDNPRFVITNLNSLPEHVYSEVYCPRGAMEKALNELKGGLYLDRTSCTDFMANQVRVLLAATAYALVQELRTQARGQCVERWEVAHLRARLFKVAAIVGESTRRWVLKISKFAPDLDIFCAVARCCYAAPA